MIAPAMVFGWWLAASMPVAHAHPATHPTFAEMPSLETATGTGGATGERKAKAGPTAFAVIPPDRAPLKGTITPAMVRAAHSYLDLPMGSERAEEVEGRRLLFVLEWHYHPPGFVGGPNGWHKGVTIYEDLR
ncbi:MAG TPA: hypothetical protein VKU41_24850 [Polyangiaceae bacterium]|nr:hypothetical protein [Polyangiaceae bacterium]